jgi:hypothetical protein
MVTDDFCDIPQSLHTNARVLFPKPRHDHFEGYGAYMDHEM